MLLLQVVGEESVVQRYALVRDVERSPLETVRRYLPWNYAAHAVEGGILIHGEDNAGWTLDGYVIPRLASGLHRADEISEAEADALP